MSIGLLLVIMLIVLFIGTPIGIGLGIAAFLPYLWDGGKEILIGAMFIVRQAISGVDSYPLLAVPMFILSGILMAKGGVSKKLFNVFTYFLANKTAGMPCAVVITCLFYGAISGSGPATTAAVGSMTIPILISMGYDLKFSTAIVAVAGGLGVIIPPSIPFILYASATGVSPGDMFVAGIIPGILIAVCLMVYSFIYCKKNGEDKEKLKQHHDELHDKGFWSVFKDSFWALLSPVIILGSIYGGIATPTEAAVISVIYSLIVSLFIYRTMKISELWDVLSESIHTYSGLLFILAAAGAFGKILTLMDIPAIVQNFLLTHFTSSVALILAINVFLLFVGMILDTSPAILILSPILVNVATSIGIDPIHFGIIMVVNLAIGFVTPPMGVNLFVASSLTDLPVMTIARKAVPMIIAFLVALLLITFIPQLSLALL